MYINQDWILHTITHQLVPEEEKNLIIFTYRVIKTEYVRLETK